MLSGIITVYLFFLENDLNKFNINQRMRSENFEDFDDFLEKLRSSGKLIIVEGAKDKNALKSLGITNTFMMNGKPLFKIVEEVAEITKECVILTDFDSEGKKLYGRLNSGLQRLGVKVDHRFREFLIRKTRLSHVEGILSYKEHQNQ
ncbi:toprim domain-containing protein [Candidatus Woesearchaeota archaeon]|nr:MAG: toprim domain-containing protein [Candidatus Woesearchaeota archaeon]